MYFNVGAELFVCCELSYLLDAGYGRSSRILPIYEDTRFERGCAYLSCLDTQLRAGLQLFGIVSCVWLYGDTKVLRTLCWDRDQILESPSGPVGTCCA